MNLLNIYACLSSFLGVYFISLFIKGRWMNVIDPSGKSLCFHWWNLGTFIMFQELLIVFLISLSLMFPGAVSRVTKTNGTTKVT